MQKRAIFATFLALAAAGCAGDERHDQLVAEVNRLRIETYQRTYEAAALRQMLDRVTVELRTREPVNMELMRRYGELANTFSDVSKQCAAQSNATLEARRPSSAAASLPGRDPSPDAGRGRQIDDRLFDDRR